MVTEEELLHYEKPRRKKSDDKDIVHSVFDTTGIKHTTIAVVMREIFKEIRKRIDDGNEISIDDFGRWTFADRKPLISHDISTGGKVYTPARSSIKFVPVSTWRWKQFFRSSIMPDELPDGVQLSQRLNNSPSYRKLLEEQGKSKVLDKGTSANQKHWIRK